MTRHPQRTSELNALLRDSASDQRWWGDGPPHWIEAQGRDWERACTTAQEADRRRERAVHLLRLHVDEVPEALNIADRLDNCTPRYPCLSGACPCCARAFQRWFVSAGRHLLKNGLGNSRVLMCTAVADYGKASLDSLPSFDLNACSERQIRDLACQWVLIAFGGVDLSVNVAANGSSEPFVQIQYTLFVVPTSRTNLNKFRSSLNRSKVIDRPLMCKPFDGERVGFAYAMKPSFVKRERYTVERQYGSDRPPHFNTRDRPLRGPAWAKVMAFLDRVGPDQRLILWGVKSVKTRGRVRLRLTARA